MLRLHLGLSQQVNLKESANPGHLDLSQSLHNLVASLLQIKILALQVILVSHLQLLYLGLKLLHFLAVLLVLLE